MSQPMTGQRLETLHVLYTAANHWPHTYDVKMKYASPVVMFLISDLKFSIGLKFDHVSISN